MGFFIADFETELKQHLNLSSDAWLIIEEDVKNFNICGKHTLSGFLNRIFTNFYQEALATISHRLMTKKDELEHVFSSKEFRGMDIKTIETYATKLLAIYKKELTNKACKYEKGEGRKFRINKENVEILRESSESAYFNNSIGLYLKAIFEEYAKKPIYEREKIYFKEIIDELENAIFRKKSVKMSVAMDTNCMSQSTSTKFYFTPYKIIQDKVGMNNYVIGYIEKLEQEDTRIWDKQIVCYPLSIIESVRLMTTKSGFISKANKEELEKALKNKEPQFITGDLIEVKVMFSCEGFEKFNHLSYLRPNSFNVLDKEKNIYEFHCTEEQAFSYFFSFGENAVILEPQSLKEKFKKAYLDASKKYQI